MSKTHLIKDESLGGILRENIEIDGNLYVTDIIHVDGKRYRMVDRKANVGDKVIQTSNWNTECGKVSKVEEVYSDGSGVECANPLRHTEYRVLEPVESQSTDQLDIIARLTRKVAQLERENTDIKRDLETWAQEVERLKRKLDDDRRDIEMVIDDVVTLDERTQPEELANKLVEAITKGLNALEPRHFG